MGGQTFFLHKFLFWSVPLYPKGVIFNSFFFFFKQALRLFRQDITKKYNCDVNNVYNLSWSHYFFL